MKLIKVIKNLKLENSKEIIRNFIKLNYINSKTNQLIKSIKYQTKPVSPKILLSKVQDFLEKKIEGEKIEVALNTSTRWAKIITWSLIGGTGFGIAWLSIAKTEEIIIATGKLEPIGGVVEIKMPLRGVTQEILVKEGDLVKKGQVLIKLDGEASQAKEKALRKSQEINSGILESLEFLKDEGAISKVQYLQQQNKVYEIESELTANQVTLKYQKITSPVDGLVFDLKPRKAGYVADPNQPIVKIVPNGKLIANVEIDSRSIGFVSVNRPADISIDSFPASDFGIIQGKVKSISSDALPPDPRLGKGFRFPAKITLEQQFLELKNKKQLPLQVGMSLTANIKLRKVSYLQLLLNTFQQKTDSLRTM